MKIIRWGVIGTGKIAHKFAQDIQKVPFCKLQAVASRTKSKANLFAKVYSNPDVYEGYEELINSLNVDAIYIATPHPFHMENTLLALRYKKPVLVEKPSAMNSAELKQMVDASINNETLLMEAMWTAFLPHFQFVQELLEKKHFGNILKLKADFGFKAKYDSNSRVINKELGGGSLLDIGIYPIFTALSSLGIPKNISAKATYFDTGADSTCSIQFEYPKPQIAILESSLIENTNTEAIFKCEHGDIKILGRFHEPSSVELTDSNGNKEQISFPVESLGYSYEVDHFNELIREGKTESPIMTFKKSLNLMTLLDRVREKIELQY